MPANERRSAAELFTQRGAMEIVACALALLAYIGTLTFGFVYDDIPQIVNNAAIKDWGHVPQFFTTHVWANIYPGSLGNYYRPFFLLWLRGNYALWGLSPMGWHLASVFCHVAMTWLVFVTTERLAKDRKTAFVAALLFGIHPCHIESVSWISGAADILAAIGFTGSFLSYVQYRDKGKKTWLFFSLLLFVFSLLTKESTAPLPLLIVTYEICSQSERKRFGLQAGYWAVLAAYFGLRFVTLHGVLHTTAKISWSEMARSWPGVLWFDARHLVWPVGLSEFYPPPATSGAGDYLLPLAGLLLMCGVFVFLARWISQRATALFAIAWLAIGLLPSLYLRGLTQGDVVHDRYLYLPSVGFVVLVALALAQLGERFGEHDRKITYGIVAVAAALCLTATFVQQVQWGSNLLLYQRGMATAPNNLSVKDNFANALLESGQFDRAIPIYQEVLQRDPAFWRSTYNLGFTYYKVGNYPAAEQTLKRAIQLDPQDSDQFFYLGLAQMKQGRRLDAVENLQRAIQRNSTAPGYHFVLGVLLSASGERSRAAAEFRSELEVNPTNTNARNALQQLESAP